jgi:hypothetical protein
MEINAEETKVMISKELLPVQLTIDHKKLEKVEYLNYFGSLINDARYKHKIKSRTAMAIAAFKQKMSLFNIDWT